MLDAILKKLGKHNDAIALNVKVNYLQQGFDPMLGDEAEFLINWLNEQIEAGKLIKKIRVMPVSEAVMHMDDLTEDEVAWCESIEGENALEDFYLPNEEGEWVLYFVA